MYLKRWLMLGIASGLALLLMGTMLLLLSSAPVQAAPATTTRYVSSSAGTDSGECTFDAPCKTIQYALAKADPGDTLAIAGGSYNGTVEVTKTATLEGGYLRLCWPGPNCLWLRPTPCDPSLTVLDGLRAGRVISIGSGVAITIDCLTVTGGDAARLGGSVYGDDAGGGVYAQQPSSVLISNAVITNNTASRSGYGGGVYVYGGPLVLSNTQVVSNLAHFGGGVYLVVAHSSAIEKSYIAKNIAWGAYGGGMYIYQTYNVEIAASSFLTNSATHYGGIGTYLAKGLTITGSLFSGNEAGGNCGGVSIRWSEDSQMLHNTIASNSAASKAGGIYIEGYPSLLSNNSIANNEAEQGGGVYVYNCDEEEVLSANRIFNNDADYGGGIYLKESASSLRNNFIFANSASYSGGGNGGGIYVDGGTSQMVHNTLALNSSGGWGSGVHVVHAATAHLTNTILVGYPYNNYASGIYVSSGATATLEATLWGTDTWAYKYDWAGDGTILTGTTNIWEEPGFVNPCGDDYHLDQGSAAIGWGVDAGVATDFDGEARIGAPDLGADEYVTYTYLPLTLKHYQ